jgi:hypothetical protein
MNEILEARREDLIQALKQSALALSELTGAPGLLVEIPGSMPKTYLALGSPESIRELLVTAE